MKRLVKVLKDLIAKAERRGSSSRRSSASRVPASPTATARCEGRSEPTRQLGQQPVQLAGKSDRTHAADRGARYGHGHAQRWRGGTIRGPFTRHGGGQCPLHQPQRQRRTLTPILIRSRSASRRYLPHGLHDLFRMIMLLQGQTARHWTGRYRRKSSRIDHWQSGVMLATAFGDRPPVDGSRQLDVGDQHIRDPPPAPCQCRFAVARVDHVVSFLSQRLDDEFADKGRPRRQVLAPAAPRHPEI